MIQRIPFLSVKNISDSKEQLWMFWLILKIMGINSDHPSTNTKKKYVRNIISLSFTIFLFICASIAFSHYLIRNIFPQGNKYMDVSGSIYVLAVILMHLSLVRRTSDFQQLRKQMNSFPVVRKLSGMFRLIYTFVFLVVLLPIAMAFAFLYFGKQELGLFTIFTFKEEATTTNLAIAYVVLNNFTLETVPSVLNCVFCALCHYWKEAIMTARLDAVNKCEMCLRGDISRPDDTALDALERCLNLWTTTKLLKNTFASFLFYLVVTLIMGMFFLIAMFMKFQNRAFLNVSMLLMFIRLSFNFTSCVYFASRIPEEMEELVTCLSEIHGRLFFKSMDKRFETMRKQMKVVMMQKPIALSLGGWVGMRKSLIFVTFGGLLSYGLLVIQNT